jgi:methionyl-tRNA synthetase
MIARYRDGTVAKVQPDVPVDFDSLRRDVIGRIDVFDVTGALDQIWDAVRRLNQYVSTEAPWQLAKDEANAERLDRVLYTLVDGLTSVAVLLAAFLPESAPKILAALGQGEDTSLDRVRNGGAAAVDEIEASEPLFPRIELPSAAA